MNILLINHYAGSVCHGMEFRPYYMAREWVRAGHKVQIVAASHSHIRAKQPILEDTAVMDEIIDGIVYHWYKTPSYKGNGIARVRNMLSFMRALWTDAKKIATEFKPDVVIASSTYPMDIWPAQRIAKIAKAKLVFEVHDLWPLSPMELGGMSKWHPFIMWVQMAENYAYRHADNVVSMLPKTLGYMVSHGLNPEKWGYVPNGIDIDEWANPQPLPHDIALELANLRSKGKPIVGYAGTHGLANALDTLLDAAKQMSNEASVVLIGSGPERQHLLRRVVDEKIANILMLPAIPKASIPSFLAAIDIAFIGWHKSSIYKFGISPNKLMDYMMAGRPIIHSVDAGNDPVAEATCGYTVPPGQPEAIREAVLKIAALPLEERIAMGARGKKFILAEQTYSVLANRFLRVIGYA